MEGTIIIILSILVEGIIFLSILMINVVYMEEIHGTYAYLTHEGIKMLPMLELH